MITGARKWIDLPAEVVAGGGIMSVATIIDIGENPTPDQAHLLLGAEYQSDACFGDIDAWTEMCTTMEPQCEEPDPAPDPVKTFDNETPELVAGDPFMGQVGVQCRWGQLAEWKAAAERRYDYAERRFVDQNVVTFIETMESTLAGTYDVAQGIGRLEEAIALGYGGPATIIMPLSLVACAAEQNLVYRELDGTLRTINGSKVAGYVRTAFDTEPSTIYATGRITLIRGPKDSFVVPQMIRADGTCLPQRALAERIYVPLIECIALKLEASCP